MAGRAALRWMGGVLVAAGLAHGAFWLVTARRVEALVEEQAEALRAQGWRVALGPARLEGWPARAGVRFGPASVEGGGLAWRAGEAAVDVPLPWQFPSAGRAVAGPVRLRLGGQQVRFGAGPFLAVTSRDWVLDLSGTPILAGTDVGIAPWFEAEAVQMRPGPGSVALSARRLKTQGPVLDELSLRASAAPPFPLAGASRAAAAAWREAGGTVDVSDIALTVGRARAVGRARIGLDDALQPKLDGVLHITGWDAGLDDMAAAGVLPRPTTVAAKAVLGLLAAPTPDGGADVSVQVAGGVLLVARFPLLRVPALDWPADP